MAPPPGIHVPAPDAGALEEMLAAGRESGYAVIDLREQPDGEQPDGEQPDGEQPEEGGGMPGRASGVDLPGHALDDLSETETGLVVLLPDGTLELDAELVGYISAQNDGGSVVLILHTFPETGLIDEVTGILCGGDIVHNVQLLVDGRPVSGFRGRLSVTVEHDTPSPGVWRIGGHGELDPQPFVFDEENGLVTFFPERLSNFVVGYSAEARTIAVFRSDGDSVTLLSRGRETSSLREGQRISSGDALVTGPNSSVHITIDNSSILMLGENSRAEIVAAGRNLEIQVKSGSALVRIDGQQPHHSTTVGTQNSALAVRGTMFTVSAGEDGGDRFVMLSGHGEVDGEPLAAGYMYLRAPGADVSGEPGAVVPISVETAGDFALAAIAGNLDYLAEHLDIDLTGVEIAAAAPLPSPEEISEFAPEEPEEPEAADCDAGGDGSADDCAPMAEPDGIPLPGAGGRC